jgi:hypothetical protein
VKGRDGAPIAGAIIFSSASAIDSALPVTRVGLAA